MTLQFYYFICFVHISKPSEAKGFIIISIYINLYDHTNEQ